MKLAALIPIAGLIAVTPAIAQPGYPAVRRGDARETVPLRVRDDQVADMQRKLNDRGFAAGRIDGLWGPNTAAALKRYQAKNGLQQSGQLDSKTLAALGIAAAGSAPAVQAQAATPAPAPAAPIVTTTPAAPTSAPGVNAATGVAPGTGLVDRNTGAAAASGNRNQAVATTSADAPQPAKGANSFSRGEARRRIEGHGFTAVADLKKDTDGIWRGHATKDSASVAVWLDYKGNIGQQ